MAIAGGRAKLLARCVGVDADSAERRRGRRGGWAARPGGNGEGVRIGGGLLLTVGLLAAPLLATGTVAGAVTPGNTPQPSALTPALAVSQAEAAVTKAAPTVKSFGVTPSSLTFTGGVVTLTAQVTKATKCVFSSKPTISGMPSTVGLRSGLHYSIGTRQPILQGRHLHILPLGDRLHDGERQGRRAHGRRQPIRSGGHVAGRLPQALWPETRRSPSRAGSSTALRL